MDPSAPRSDDDPPAAPPPPSPDAAGQRAHPSAREELDALWAMLGEPPAKRPPAPPTRPLPKP